MTIIDDSSAGPLSPCIVLTFVALCPYCIHTFRFAVQLHDDVTISIRHVDGLADSQALQDSWRSELIIVDEEVDRPPLRDYKEKPEDGTLSDKQRLAILSRMITNEVRQHTQFFCRSESWKKEGGGRRRN